MFFKPNYFIVSFWLIFFQLSGPSMLLFLLKKKSNLWFNKLVKSEFDEDLFKLIFGILFSVLFGLMSWLVLPKFIVVVVVFLLSLWGILALFIKKKFEAIILRVTVIVIILSVSIIGFGLPVIKPALLPDGPYVSKDFNLSSKMQYLFGNLPCDNTLPYYVTEYMVRRISFNENNPILPNQPVMNRGVFASLICTPISKILFENSYNLKDNNVPLFNYAGSNWPNSFILYSDKNYSVFLGCYLGLFAFILLRIVSGIHNTFGFEKSVYFVALFFTSYYAFSQTLFTWPKMFTGLFGAYIFLVYKNIFREDQFSYLSGRGAVFLFLCIATQFHPVGYFLGFFIITIEIIIFLNYFFIDSKIMKYIADLFSLKDVFFIMLGLFILAAWFGVKKFGGISANLWGQNNLQDLSLHESIAIHLHSVFDYFPVPFRLSFFSNGWLTYIGSFAPLMLPVFFKRPLLYIFLNGYVLLFSFLISIPFGFISPTIIIGMQVLFPFIAIFITELITYKEMLIISALQSLLFFIFVQSMYNVQISFLGVLMLCSIPVIITAVCSSVLLIRDTNKSHKPFLIAGNQYHKERV